MPITVEGLAFLADEAAVAIPLVAVVGAVVHQLAVALNEVGLLGTLDTAAVLPRDALVHVRGALGGLFTALPVDQTVGGVAYSALVQLLRLAPIHLRAVVEELLLVAASLIVVGITGEFVAHIAGAVVGVRDAEVRHFVAVLVGVLV